MNPGADKQVHRPDLVVRVLFQRWHFPATAVGDSESGSNLGADQCHILWIPLWMNQ